MCRKRILSPEEKVRLVESYISGKMSRAEVISRNGISLTAFKDWVRKYKRQGSQGLMPSTQWTRYSPELKLQAVREYLSGESSQSAIRLKYNISDRSVLRKWIKDYNSHRDFKQPNNGGFIYMTKGRATTREERIEIVSDCIAHNKDYGKSIEKYGISYQQIYRWVRKYEKDGVDGLSDRRGKRKDESSMTEVEKLRGQLKLKSAENIRLKMENELLKKLEALERGIVRN